MGKVTVNVIVPFMKKDSRVPSPAKIIPELKIQSPRDQHDAPGYILGAMVGHTMHPQFSMT